MGISGFPGVGRGAPPAHDLTALVQLELLKELRRSRAGEDQEFGDSTGTRGLGRTLNRYHAMRRRVDTAPEAIISSYVDRMREQVGVEPGQPWTMMDVNRRLGWGKFKTLQRSHYLLAQVFQKLDTGDVLAGQALCVQGMKAMHQSALDQGSFEAAWLLTGLPDPLKKEKFGGEPEELEVISQYMKALEDVAKRSKPAGGGDDEEEKGPKGGGKNGKHGAAQPRKED